MTAHSARSAHSAHSASAAPGFIGVDVAKDFLVIAHGPQDAQTTTIKNSRRAIRDLLKTLPVGSCLAVESTNCYHQLLADMAHAAGLRVYLLNPKQLKHYRNATRGRAKTDRCDAQLLARYLEREHTALHPYTPLSAGQRRLCDLLRRRATVVKSQTQLRQSLRDHAKDLGLQRSFQASLRALRQLLRDIDTQIQALLQHTDQKAAAARLQSIVGIGPLSGAALLVALERGQFASADAFVAFLGLDPVPCESGQRRGRRRLSKQGDSETRRLLYTAAMSASQTKVWQPLYERCLARGLSRIQALVILARKLAITAWSLYKHGTTFSPARLTTALT
jgi:transposase